MVNNKFMKKITGFFISAATVYSLLATLHIPSVYAIAITAGPTLSNTTITAESGTNSGTTIQFTLDSPGEVIFDFFQVANSTLTSVATLVRSYPAGPQTFFWNALWLIGTEAGRHNGTYSYQVTPSTLNTFGTSLPTSGDPSALFTIDSVDIHNVVVTPSLDSNAQPTFPYTIRYGLSKTSLVTATISNSSGTVVRTLLSAARQPGESVSTTTITWDGLGTDGQPVALGNYTLTLDASDPSTGARANTRTKPLEVLSLAGSGSDPKSLFTNNVFVFPNPVRDGQGTFNIEAVRDGATLSLKIYTISGDLVLSKSFPGVPSGSIMRFVWDTTNQSGNKVGRGLYYYVAREEDSQGTLQTVKKMAVLP